MRFYLDTFGFPSQGVAQILWVIGWSMIILAILIYLPRWLILTIARLLSLEGHNLLDPVSASPYRFWVIWLWPIMHEKRKYYISSWY